MSSGFDLPERQAKVNQLVKAMEHSGDIQYCICRSTDCSRFMIGCDNCEEWYHGDCIDVTEFMSRSIKKFYCAACQAKDPTLKTKYKTKKPKKEIKLKPETLTSDSMDYREKLREKDSMYKQRKSNRRCGECVACHRTEDCSRCDFCKDMKKFGGMNKIRQKCRLRQCISFGLSGPIALARREPKEYINVYHDPGMLGPPSSNPEDLYRSSDDEQRENLLSPFSEKPAKKRKKRQSGSEKGSPRRKTQKTKDKNKKSPGRKKQKPKGKASDKHHKHQKHHHQTDHYEDRHIPEPVEEEQPRQCYGPACIEYARTGSKYCSDDCGMKLAKSRIYELLPPKIQQWQSSPCVAEENNKRSLEKIRRQQLETRQMLQQLDMRHRELDALIERARHATVAPEQESSETEDDTEFSIYCVTCGSEINQRSAIRHMEKCFAKFEAQTSFGSIYKTRIEGTSMFCDFYNPQQKTYCKRLKVLCPEHTKDPRVGPEDVCGCPLVANVFEETGEFCRVLKRKCTKHYCWEKLRRAEIDMERVRQWLRLDELFEQERNVRVSMSNRMGVLGLMLHQTIDHDPLNPIIVPDMD